MNTWPLTYFSIENQVAVVTGASSGIGRHMALTLAQAGAQVIALARRQQALDDLSAELTQRTEHTAEAGENTPPGTIVGHSCDLMQVSDYNALADTLREPFGAPSIVINAAGVNYRQPADAITPQSWNDTLHLNLSVPFFLSRALVQHMPPNGSIINIASLQSERAFPDSMPYGASKGGVAQLTRAMAEEWSARGIRCNAIAPGFFPTELTQAVFDNEERAAANAAQTCIGRNGELDDLTGPTLFLCSAASAYVTGQVLFVDGGFTAR